MFLRFSIFATCLACSVAQAQAPAGAAPANPAAAICQNYALPIGSDDVDLPNIPVEFGGLTAEQFQPKLRQQLQAAPLNTVFPNARFFARSFEHRAIGYLYDRVVLQADVSALSFLIRLTQSTNAQIRTDALSAVAFVHFQMASSADIQRGLAHIQAAIKGANSYPALVFWGRSHVWGGDYSDKNLTTAMNYLAAAGRLPGERREQNNRMDPLNTEEVHTQTLKHLIENVPEMPYRSSYEPVYAQGAAIMRMQEEYKLNYAKSSDFDPVTPVLQELDTLLRSPALTQAFELDTVSTPSSGWDRLHAALAQQERMAQRVHGPDALTAPQKQMLSQLNALNQKLQTALVQLQRGLIFQLMNSKEAFPNNIKALKSLTGVEQGLSRSCSLSATWQLHLP